MSRLVRSSVAIAVAVGLAAGCASHASDHGHDEAEGSAAAASGGSAAVDPAPAPAPAKAAAPAPAPASGSAAPGPAAPEVAAPAAQAALPDRSGLIADDDGVLHGALPARLPAQVAAVLAEPIGKHVVVRFVEMGRARSSAVNYRWDLLRSGRLYFVRHSDTPGAAAAPFDRPLPDKPSLKVDEKHRKEIFSTLKAQGFWDHPGYEVAPGADPESTIVIVEARDPKTKEVKTVVYDGSRPDLLDFLEAVTVSL